LGGRKKPPAGKRQSVWKIQPARKRPPGFLLNATDESPSIRGAWGAKEWGVNFNRNRHIEHIRFFLCPPQSPQLGGRKKPPAGKNPPAFMVQSHG